MDKKAQGLSLNTIIVAIIVLVVLVVLILVFTGYFGGKFTPGVTSCTSAGGECIAANECGNDVFGQKLGTLEAQDCSEPSVCCRKGLGSSSETTTTTTGTTSAKEGSGSGQLGEACRATSPRCDDGALCIDNTCISTRPPP